MRTLKSDRALIRAHGTVVRNGLTDVMKAHGVKGRGYMLCTDTINAEVLGGRAWQIRAANDLAPKANLREHLDSITLSLLLITEHKLAARIEENMVIGNQACIELSEKVAKEVMRAFK